MVYNLTALENNTNILELFTVMNTLSNEFLTIGIMVIVFIVLFIAFKNYETVTALTTSSFITSIIGLLFWITGFISTQYMLMPVILTGLMILWSIIQKN